MVFLKKVLFTEKTHADAVKQLKATAKFNISAEDSISAANLLAEIGKYDAVVVRTYTKITKDVIDRAKNLKLIVRAGVGLDNIDVRYAKEKGIIVKNTPKANYLSVAEHTIALMQTLLRNIPQADLYIRQQKGWDRKKFLGEELNGKTLGLIGIGLIGSEVARLAQAFSMDVIAYDPFISGADMKKGGVIKKEDLLDIAKESDIISVHVPLLDQTHHLIGKKFIAEMKATAIIVNTSRGPVIDQDALVSALEKQKIKGAALDVFTEEPPKDKKLLSLKNTVFTPHLGAMTKEADRRMCIHAVEEVIDFFR